MQLQIKCPHCGFNNRIKCDIDPPPLLPDVAVCCLEDGGCDKPFAFTVEVKTEIKTFTFQEKKP